MLKALYDYAIREGLTLPPGYVNNTIRAYISLSTDGRFIDIQEAGTEKIPIPDIGSSKNSKDKCNVLIEKRSVIASLEKSVKNTYFIAALRDGGEIEPLLKVCADALENTETLSRIINRLDEKKIKDSDRLSFLVDGCSILESKLTLKWWLEFRKQFLPSDGDNAASCLITGVETSPVATTPKINGLHSVGGHAGGDALICFDKSAFCSFNLKQGANAPVSEEAFSAVKSALDKLIADSPPKLAGMRFVHWYDCEIPKENDPLLEEDIFGMGDSDDEEDDESDTYDPQTAIDAHSQANKLIESVTGKEDVSLSADISYYILLLSGVNGRVMIRRYERGNYKDLKEKIELWKNDLQLTKSRGAGELSSCKLSARLLKLMKYQKTDSRPFDRLDKELSGLTPAIINSILTGGQLPEAVAARALAFIRSEMMSADEDTAEALFTKDASVWQWLKVYLLRNKGKRGMLMSEYNPDYKSNAYHCGAMVAVYEAIQRAAMPEVNASVVQRYYGSAIQTPAYVLGTLSKMSRHHLDKLSQDKINPGVYYSKKLDEISRSMDASSMPTALNLTEQSEFALGYYQMRAELYKKNDNKENK